MEYLQQSQCHIRLDLQLMQSKFCVRGCFSHPGPPGQTGSNSVAGGHPSKGITYVVRETECFVKKKPDDSEGWVVSNALSPTGTEDRQCTGGADVMLVV